MNSIKIIFLALIAVISGCVNAADHHRELHSVNERKLTVGLVQREIHRGMSQDEVASALGSPNIVSKDRAGNETWIYDKIATEASYSRSRGSASILGGVAADVGSVLLLGIPSAAYDKEAGASASTQRTLTVVIKYDQRSLVDVATYHASSF